MAEWALIFADEGRPCGSLAREDLDATEGKNMLALWKYMRWQQEISFIERILLIR
ncbi:hypothetical protein [Selenomonas ruminantium]|uniref:hypothetical protein n=1 Tax=Selenomonas ruminantium TaxID=971 RepID=UPI0015BDB2BC|nr:hypothetical protein [Selenomonas ruminantium]